MSQHGTSEHIFYDGECGVCHWAVKFVAKRDANDAFRFAPLHGDTFTGKVSEEERQSLPDSMIVLKDDGSLLMRSSGLVHILRRLGGFWGLLGHLLWVVPRPLRNLGYDAFAAIRSYVVKKPEGFCPMVPPEIGRRFDP